MKKKLFRYCMLGFLIGEFYNLLVPLCISVGMGDGLFYPVTPALIEQAGTELNAVLLQFFLSGAMGIAVGAISLVWKQENWSLLKQTGLYFAGLCCALFPAAYFSYWMEHSMKGVLRYIGIFLLVFVCIWLARYLFWKKRVSRINQELQKKATSRP